MSIKYLGNHFDIHTGGIDHIPIHHTNEIAQSQCSCADTPWVNYRVHYQFLNIAGKKISKSLGNVVTLDEVFERGYSAEDLRYFFFQANYRSFQDFTRESLEAASKGRKKLKLVSDEKYPRDEVVTPLLDDLNTPIFLANIQKYGISERLNTIYKLYKLEEIIDIPSDIEQLAEQRRQAKLNKDRTTADNLKQQIIAA
jgi:cysteinyl-tRNA synthetase